MSADATTARLTRAQAGGYATRVPAPAALDDYELRKAWAQCTGAEPPARPLYWRQVKQRCADRDRDRQHALAPIVRRTLREHGVFECASAAWA